MKKTEIVMVPIDKIKPDPNQPRKSFDEEKLRESAESCKTHGTIVPIEIDENNQIIIGELRWRAAKEAGLKEMPCIIKRGCQVLDKRERQLVENLDRQDISDIELLPSIRELMTARGWSQTETSKRLGISVPRLNHLLKVKGLPKKIQDAVKKGEITTAHAEELSRLPADKEKLKFLNSAKIMSRDKLRREISDYLNPRRKIEREIKKPQIRKNALEELEKVEKEEKEVKKEIKKAKREHLANIIDTGKAVAEGRLKAGAVKIVRVDEKRLNKIKDLRKRVCFLSLSSIEIIRSDKLRKDAVRGLIKMRDHLNWLVSKAQSCNWYKM